MAFFDFIEKAARGDKKPGGGFFGFLDDTRKYGRESFREAVPKVAKGTRDVGVSTAREIAKIPETAVRSTAELEARGINKVFGANLKTDYSLNVSDPLRKKLYGDDRIKTYQQRGEGIEEAKGIPAPLAALGLFALDFTPIGKGKGGIKGLVKAQTPQEVKKILKNVDDTTALAIAKATDSGTIERIIKSKAPSPSPIQDITRPPTPVDPYKLGQDKGTVALTGERLPQRVGQPTTRQQQFTDILNKQMIDDIEKNPELKDLSQRQGHQETYRLAAEAGPLDLTRIRPGRAISAPDVVRARASLEPYFKQATEAIKSGDNPTIIKSLDEAIKAYKGFHNVTSEPGRALEVMKTFQDDSVKYLENLTDYYKTTGGKLTPGQLAELQRGLQKSLKSADSLPENLKSTALNLVRGLEEFATSAKISSPVSHLRNIIGNTLTFGLRAIEKPIAVGIGTTRGRTGLGEAKYTLGTLSGWQSASSKFASIMKDALLLRQTPTAETSRLAREGYKEAIPGKFGAAVRIPFKFLEAADEFGKTILRDSRLHSEAYELARREGFRGKELTDRITKLIENPTLSMRKAAEKEALEFTFQSELGKVGKIGTTLQSIPGGRLFLPFVKTPTNIIKFYAQRSPLGVASPRNLTDIFKGTTKTQDEAIARILVGSTLSAGAMAYVFSNPDKITGRAPTNPTEKDAFYSSGKQPYSVKVGGRWVSYQNFQPVGMFMLAAVSLRDALKKGEEDEASNIAATMVGTASKGILELPFVQGMNNILNALNDPDRYAYRAFERLVTGVVPNLARDFRLYTDEIVRSPQNLKDAIYDMLPGLSKQVEPRQNVFGESIKRTGSAVERSFLRFGGVKETEAPETIKLLDQVGKETGYYPGMPGKTIAGKKLSDKQHRKYVELSGQYLKESLDYVRDILVEADIPPETKESVLKEMVSNARLRARYELGFYEGGEL